MDELAEKIPYDRDAFLEVLSRLSTEDVAFREIDIGTRLIPIAYGAVEYVIMMFDYGDGSECVTVFLPWRSNNGPRRQDIDRTALYLHGHVVLSQADATLEKAIAALALAEERRELPGSVQKAEAQAAESI